MKSIIARNGIKFFVAGLFVVAIGLTIILNKYNEAMERPVSEQYMRGVVASDTIRGDTYRLKADSTISKF